MAGHNCLRGRPGERRLPRQPSGVDVAPAIQMAVPRRLLGAHLCGGPECKAGLGQLLPPATSTARAIPKSATELCSPEIRIFSGLTSRCTTPCWWALPAHSALGPRVTERRRWRAAGRAEADRAETLPRHTASHSRAAPRQTRSRRGRECWDGRRRPRPEFPEETVRAPSAVASSGRKSLIATRRACLRSRAR